MLESPARSAALPMDACRSTILPVAAHTCVCVCVRARARVCIIDDAYDSHIYNDIYFLS